MIRPTSLKNGLKSFDDFIGFTTGPPAQQKVFELP